MASVKHNIPVKYKLVPPDGGWGYLITVSVIIMNVVTGIPLNVFGIVFGNFLASLGDVTAATTLVNGIFNTVQSFTGLASSYLLRKYSYRKVGILGASLYFIGTVATIFVRSLPQLILSFGFLEGLGFGLMITASFSAFNCYFDRKINMMMGIAQATMVLANMASPPIAAVIAESFGFKGGVISLACLALLNFPAMGIMQPVKWHMKKTDLVTTEENTALEITNEYETINTWNNEFTRTQSVPLLATETTEGENNIKPSNSPGLETVMDPRRRSVMSLGDRAVSVITLNDLNPEEEKSSKSMDFSLFKDAKYLNISCGIAICFTSDIAFNAIIPLVLNNVNFEKSTVAFMMVVFFGADLVSRIMISILSALYTIRNRYVFLAGAFLTALLRIAFTLYTSYTWKLGTLAILGFLRCWIQTPLALVIAEEYKDNFPTAFSLYMVVCGFISLVLGPLMSYVKSLTKSDDMVIHVLTISLLLCSLSWTIELLWSNIKEWCYRRKRGDPTITCDNSISSKTS